MTPAVRPRFFLALALTLVMSSPCAFAQQGSERQRNQNPDRTLEREPRHLPSAPSLPALTTTPNFSGHSHHGSLDWKQGRWRHEKRKDRFGWWWDVGGVLYFYPQQIEGPPDYVSNIEVAAEDAAPPPLPPPSEPHRAVYYPPGDLKGIPYNTIEECNNADKQAGNNGICVLK